MVHIILNPTPGADQAIDESDETTVDNKQRKDSKLPFVERAKRVPSRQYRDRKKKKHRPKQFRLVAKSYDEVGRQA